MTALTLERVGTQDDRAARSLPASASTAITVALVLSMLISWSLYLVDGERWGFALLGTTATTVLWAPLGARVISPFSLWGAGFLVSFIGFCLRGIYLSLDNDPVVDFFFVQNRGFDEFGFTPIVVLGVIVALTVGYSASIRGQMSSGSSPASWLTSVDMTSPGLRIMTWVLALAGMAGTVLYVGAVGGLGESSISNRRTIITTVDLEQQASFQSYGHWEYLASLGFVAFALALTRYIYLDQRSTTSRIQLLALGVNAMFLPWFTTTRAEIISIGLAVLALVWHAGRPMPVRRLAAVLLAAVIAGTAFTAARTGESLIDQSASELTTEMADTVLLNRNMFDIGKTLLVTDAVGEELDLSYGSTVFGYTIAFIPRQIWPTKPLVSPGPIVGTEVYGNRVSGVPPGFASELVWSVGPLAALVLAIGLGGLLARIDRYAVTAARTPAGAVFLATVAMQVGRDIFGVSIGRAAFSLLLGTAILAGTFFSARLLDGATGRMGASR